jgi:hypothetical protein
MNLYPDFLTLTCRDFDTYYSRLPFPMKIALKEWLDTTNRHYLCTDYTGEDRPLYTRAQIQSRKLSLRLLPDIVESGDYIMQNFMMFTNVLKYLPKHEITWWARVYRKVLTIEDGAVVGHLHYLLRRHPKRISRGIKNA